MSASPMQTSAKYATGAANKRDEFTVPGLGREMPVSLKSAIVYEYGKWIGARDV